MRSRVILAGLLMALTSLAGAASEPNRHVDPEVGYSIEKPPTWLFLGVEAGLKAVEQARIRDEAIRQQILDRGRKPLVVISKYNPAERAGIIPTVQIMLTPLGTLAGTPPMQILEGVLQTVRQAVEGFALAKPPHATTVGGMPAAHAVMEFRMANPYGESFAVRSRLWTVTRGEFAFQIGMTGPAEGPDVSEAEFKSILDSISIEP